MRLLVPGLFGSAVSFALQKFLQVQAITMPPAFAAAVAAVVHAPLNWLAVLENKRAVRARTPLHSRLRVSGASRDTAQTTGGAVCG